MGKITLELRLVFQIPETGLTINGLIDGLKEAVGEIDELWCQLWCLTCHSGVTLVSDLPRLPNLKGPSVPLTFRAP